MFISQKLKGEMWIPMAQDNCRCWVVISVTRHAVIKQSVRPVKCDKISELKNKRNWQFSKVVITFIHPSVIYECPGLHRNFGG